MYCSGEYGVSYRKVYLGEYVVELQGNRAAKITGASDGVSRKVYLLSDVGGSGVVEFSSFSVEYPLGVKFYTGIVWRVGEKTDVFLMNSAPVIVFIRFPSEIVILGRVFVHLYTVVDNIVNMFGACNGVVPVSGKADASQPDFLVVVAVVGTCYFIASRFSAFRLGISYIAYLQKQEFVIVV